MKLITISATLFFIMVVGVIAVARPQHQSQLSTTTVQQSQSRDATREKMRVLLNDVGPKINVAFRQSDKQPYNFVGIMNTGLTNTDSFEIVILIGDQDTMHFRIFPKYKGAYVNVNK